MIGSLAVLATVGLISELWGLISRLASLEKSELRIVAELRLMGGKRSSLEYKRLKIYGQVLLGFALTLTVQFSCGETNPSDGKNFASPLLQHFDSFVVMVSKVMPENELGLS